MRSPSPRRRVAATAAIVTGGATFAGAAIATVRDPGAGLAVLLGLAVAGGLAWRGAVRSAAVRALYFSGAVLVLCAVLVTLVVRGHVLEPIIVGVGVSAVALMVRVAFGGHGSAGGGWKPVARPKRPVLLINPRSGDGEAERIGLAEEASARGVEAAVVEPGDDPARLARAAVAGGADALGMAGGDGSQALVAAIAAAHQLPFVCVPVGTRNHLALDLGVDRRDPVGALDAFTDGVERRIDLGQVNGRTFVNNVSLGIYGEAVQQPRYRDAKLRTLLATLAEQLDPSAPTSPLQLIDDLGSRRTDAAMVLVSNNPYALNRMLGSGTRPRIDSGRLGVVLVGQPGDPGSPTRAWSAPELEISSAAPVPAAVDGDPVTLEPPLRFTTRPMALRVRISSRHPGVAPSALLPRAPSATLSQLARIAAGRS